ncbi:two-component system, OmpR family, phosphate regulon response regulator OmpR [Rhizobium sp. NFR07]|uniref:response regulator n=1 Tax=Rhizobium sp. NFR07 TaxID=1566262 RepID=UPI0008E015D1|nr:response regulator [Rhizobium sp. NFR07]SFB24566.1 two-component system, OmpR family, phosphate regulon response regulator OmpR [Rhizobium sp. NFR07]
MSFDPAHAAHILVVDDDPRIRQMLTRYFEGEGYRVTTAGDGVEMNVAMRQDGFDAVLLDLSLPGGRDGLDLARDIRASSDIPIMMLTGRDDVVDRIIGIEIGADDYIAKPFHLREVHARLKSILRRRQPANTKPAQQQTDEIVGFEGWTLNTSRRQLLDPGGREVELTTGEFDMLAAFLNHAGRVLTRDFLMDLTRGRQMEAFDRTIDAQIVRLRRKIEADPQHPQLIKAVRGVGYIFTGRIG